MASNVGKIKTNTTLVCKGKRLASRTGGSHPAMRQIPSPPSGIIPLAVCYETDNITSMAPKEVNLMTGNANKLADIRAILGPQGILVKNQALDLPEIQGTIEEITISKCRRAAELVGGPVLVDDTALCFEAMNGMPGPYIKFFLEAVGPEKLHLMLAGFSDKRAQAVATLGYSEGPGHKPVLFQGRVDGTIVPARGTLRYGWHACFEYPGTGQTFAEMDDEEKHRISHLGEAMRKLIEWLVVRSR